MAMGAAVKERDTFLPLDIPEDNLSLIWHSPAQWIKKLFERDQIGGKGL